MNGGNDGSHGGGGYGPPGGGPPGYGPPGYGPPAYGPPGYGPPAPPPGGFDRAPQFGPPGFGPSGFAPPPMHGGAPTENLAVVSLVLGILCLPGGCCCAVLVAPLAIGGIVTGILALNKINASDGTLGGKGLAIAGIVCSATALLIGVAALVLRFGILATQLFK